MKDSTNKFQFNVHHLAIGGSILVFLIYKIAYAIGQHVAYLEKGF